MQERDKLLSSDRIRKEFSYWGFDICTNTSVGEEGKDSSYGQVYLSGVPDVVADKVGYIVSKRVDVDSKSAAASW